MLVPLISSALSDSTWGGPPMAGRKPATYSGSLVFATKGGPHEDVELDHRRRRAARAGRLRLAAGREDRRPAGRPGGRLGQGRGRRSEADRHAWPRQGGTGEQGEVAAAVAESQRRDAHPDDQGRPREGPGTERAARRRRHAKRKGGAPWRRAERRGTAGRADDRAERKGRDRSGQP